MTSLMIHAWTAYPALVLTVVVVWGILLYVAGRVVRIWMEGLEDE